MSLRCPPGPERLPGRSQGEGGGDPPPVGDPPGGEHRNRADEVDDGRNERQRAAREQWEEDCKRMAWVMALQNPRFQRLRFLKACGLEVDA